MIWVSVVWPIFLSAQSSSESARNALELNAAMQDELGGEASTNSLANSDSIPDSRGDSDLGIQQILQRQPEKPKNFTLTSDVFAIATDNALYQDDGFTEEDIYFSFENSLRYSRALKPWLRLEASAPSQVLRYVDLSAVDFEVFIISGGFFASIKGVENAFVRWKLGHTSLYRDFYESSFYESLWTTGEYLHLFPISLKQSFFWRGQARFELMSSPGEIQKASFSGELNYRYKLTDKWLFNCAGRYTLSPYRESQREDSTFVLGISTSYQCTRSFNISISYYFIENQSSQSMSDYQVNTASLGIGGTYQF